MPRRAAARAIGEENKRRFYKRTRRAGTHSLEGTSFSLSSAQQVMVYMAFGITSGQVTAIRNVWDASVEKAIAEACIDLYLVRLESRISALHKGVLRELHPNAFDVAMLAISTERLEY